jgi:hypothetical protein
VRLFNEVADQPGDQQESDTNKEAHERGEEGNAKPRYHERGDNHGQPSDQQYGGSDLGELLASGLRGMEYSDNRLATGKKRSESQPENDVADDFHKSQWCSRVSATAN